MLCLPDISVEENHIYGDETRQLQIVKLYGKVLEIEEKCWKINNQFYLSIAFSDWPMHVLHFIHMQQL